MRLGRLHINVLRLAVAGLVGVAGCSEGFYRRQADREAYDIIGEKQIEETGVHGDFSIEPPVLHEEDLLRRGRLNSPVGQAEPTVPQVLAAAPRENPQMSILFDPPVEEPAVGQLVDRAAPAELPATTQPVVVDIEIPPIEGAASLFLEPAKAEGEWPAVGRGQVRPIDLVTALRLAALSNREFQTGKEAVYRSALALTGRQHDFEYQFFGTADARVVQNTARARSGAIDSRLGMTRNFTTGGRTAISLTNSLFEVFTDPTGRSASSLINMTLTQPLLRGAGYRVAAEPLIQADRNVTYQVREFERLKRRLAVLIATNYYLVVQQGDQVFNERNNYANLILARRRTEEFARAGRLPGFQVDQARQDELRARNRWLLAVQRYNQSLDAFRRLLGLPPDWPIVPDPGSLARLQAEGLTFELPDVEAAVQTAMSNRLDVRTAEDRVVDAERGIYVAADALKMGLDVRAISAVPSRAGADRPFDFTPRFGNYTLGMLVDLPLDRVNERNVYRVAIIDLNVARREMTDRLDQVAAQVRQNIRNIVRARNSYEIQESAVQLAQRRVDSTNLLLQAGRASTRDVLESQSALVEAQNALTAALVDFHIARLELLRDMEVLHVEPAGLTYHDTTTNE